jgi:hypothetical protein
MPTTAENLQTAYDNYATILADISESPKPTYSLDGQSFSWTEYQRFLLEQMAAIRMEQNLTDHAEEISEFF